MRYLLLSLLFSTSLLANEKKWELIGFIRMQADDGSDKSIVVIRDAGLQKTLYIRAGEKLPGTDWEVKELERNAVVLGNVAGENKYLELSSRSEEQVSQLESAASSIISTAPAETH